MELLTGFQGSKLGRFSASSHKERHGTERSGTTNGTMNGMAALKVGTVGTVQVPFVLCVNEQFKTVHFAVPLPFV